MLTDASARSPGRARLGGMRLHLVDGTFELYRAHYSKRPEQPFKASIGLTQSLLALLKDPVEKVTHLAIAFDNPIRCFRNDLFAGYKTDEGVPPELREQFDLAEEGAPAAAARCSPGTGRAAGRA